MEMRRHAASPVRTLSVPAEPLTLLLIDDDPSACDGVVALVHDKPDWRLMFAPEAIEMALEMVRDTRPDVVLVRAGQASAERLTLVGALHGQSPASRVVVLGLAAEHEGVWGLVRAGASGFIMATATAREFQESIRMVASGQQVLPPELTGSLFAQLTGPQVPTPPREVLGVRQLTSREQKVAGLITQGLSNREISARLEIGLPTVKNLVRNVLARATACA